MVGRAALTVKVPDRNATASGEKIVVSARPIPAGSAMPDVGIPTVGS